MDPQILLGTVFWSFFPATATSFILKLLYSVKVLQYTPQTTKKHGSIIFTLIILTYLSVSMIKSFVSLQPTYYSVLNVSTNFKSKDLKYHPDKNGHLSRDLKDQYEEKYLLIRKAYEVLSNKNTLFAYEKFSKEIMECNTCKSKQDFMYYGLTDSLIYYGFSYLLMLVMNYFFDSAGSYYWKFFFLFTQIALEFFMLIVGVDFANHITTGEKVILLRNIGMSAYMAINSLTSVWSQGVGKISTETVSELGNICDVTTAEISQWYKLIHNPFQSDILREELDQKRKEFSKKNLKSVHDLKSTILKKND